MITSTDYGESTGAKRALMLGLAVLVCTPMVVSLLLLLAVVSPKMDAVTQHLPKGVRSMVASGILAIHDGAATPAQLQRAGHLDAETAARYRPPVFGLRTSNTPANMQEMYRQQREAKESVATLVQEAADLEKSGQECDAEELYAQAAGRNSSGDAYQYTEGMGRAGLRCGDLSGARAGLEVAIIKEKQLLSETGDDPPIKVRQDLLADRQFLIVVYQKEHETALAKQACSEAHPGAASCTCKLTPAGVSCSHASTSK